MAQSIQPPSPISALVTAFKSHENASEAPRASAQGQNSDPFGPAVISSPSSLSGATLSTIKEVATSTPALPGYDQTGHSTSGF